MIKFQPAVATLPHIVPPKSINHFLNNNARYQGIWAFAPELNMANAYGVDASSGVAVIQTSPSVQLAYLTAVQVDENLHITYNPVACLDRVFNHPQFVALEEKQRWSCLRALANQAHAIESPTEDHFCALLHALTYIAHNTNDDGTDVYDAARSYAHEASAIELPEEVVIFAGLDYSMALRYNPDAPEHGIFAHTDNGFTEVVAMSEYETLLKLSDGSYTPAACATVYEDGHLSPYNDCLRSIPEFPLHEAFGSKFTLTEEQQKMFGETEQLLAPEYGVVRDGDAYCIGEYVEVDTMDLADHFFTGL